MVIIIMFIKETDLFIETFDFIKKNFIKVFFISIFFSFIVVLSDCFIIPIMQRIYFSVISKNNSMYSLIHTFNFMTFFQQKTFLQFSFLKNIIYVVSITFIIESIIMIAQFKIFEKEKNFYNLYRIFSSFFPNLFILIFFINLVVQIGTVLLMFPAIIFSIFFSLSPIILIVEKQSILLSMQKSFLICLTKCKDLFIPIIFWFFAKFVLLIISSIIKFFPESIFLFLYNSMSNFLLCILTTYLFKFYSLFNSVKKF
ncbi:YciC family protein [Buchnera aphidicola (Astegopteryx bambusae)]|uniref:YciC family protein n=1 Tax=Buchnera aphidicola TaxID=9 RepID=UPI0031B80407